jgi:hypothetical protein
MRHTRYGNLEGAFIGRGWTLFRRGAWIWAVWLVLAASAIVFAVRQDVVSAIVVAVPAAIAMPFLYAIFQAMELRWWLEGIQIGPITVTSDLGLWVVLKCYLRTLLLWTVYSLGGSIMIGLAVGVVAGIAKLAVGDVENIAKSAGLPLAIASGVVGAILYVAFLLGFGIIRRICIDRGLRGIDRQPRPVGRPPGRQRQAALEPG